MAVSMDPYASMGKMTVIQLILFEVLHHFQHCTGHITTGSWKGRGNQYIQLVKIMCCKLPTNGKQPPAFPLGAMPGTEPPASEVGGESVPIIQLMPCTKMLQSFHSHSINEQSPGLL